MLRGKENFSVSGQGKLTDFLVLQIKDRKEICLLPVNILEYNNKKLFHLEEYIGIEINMSMLGSQELTGLCSLEILYKKVPISSYPKQPSNILKYYRNQGRYHKSLRLKTECDALIFSESKGKIFFVLKTTPAPDTSLVYFWKQFSRASKGRPVFFFWSERVGLLCRKCIHIPDIRRWTSSQEGALHSTLRHILCFISYHVPSTLYNVWGHRITLRRLSSP